VRVLLTGGAGYVGSACLRRLLREGVEAFAFDDLSTGHRASVPAGRLIVGDVNDGAAVESALATTRADAVMHFAAATTIDQSVTDPAVHYRNNVGGTLSLLQAMRRAGVSRLLFSSTCATYGTNPRIPMTEDAAQDPCSPYARTKLAVEWMIRDFAKPYRIGHTILRYFNAAGASPDGAHGEHHDPETHLIPLVLQVPLGRRREIRIFGEDYPTPDGTCIRDYVHVDDLAEAHLLAIRATDRDTAEVYNVGTGTGSSVREVIEACEQVVGVEIPRRSEARREGDAPALVASPEKIRARLRWEPRHRTIREVVATAWAWHRTHPDGYAADGDA
jgi:UDP-glucose 4-epimerase